MHELAGINFCAGDLYTGCILQMNREKGAAVTKAIGDTLHGNVANYIRSKIYAKEWGAGTCIPSEHQLMEEFGISRGTVRKAIKALVDEGLLKKEHGRGTFVSEPHIVHPGGDRPFSFAESLAEQGISFETEVLNKERIEATPEVAEKLQIKQGDPVLKLRRVRRAGGKAIMVLDSWTPLEICPGIENMPLEEMSLFDAVEAATGAHIELSHMVYSARSAGKDLANVMEVSESSPILNLEQLIFLDDGRPIEWGDTMLAAGQTIVGVGHQRRDQASRE